MLWHKRDTQHGKPSLWTEYVKVVAETIMFKVIQIFSIFSLIFKAMLPCTRPTPWQIFKSEPRSYRTLFSVLSVVALENNIIYILYT